MDYLYTLSGFGVGAIVGLTGVGGGSLMTPLLVLLFGVPPATAVGTDLLYAAMTKAGGTVAHGPTEVPGGAFIAVAQDPQGAWFAVVGPKDTV